MYANSKIQMIFVIMSQLQEKFDNQIPHPKHPKNFSLEKTLNR
jgi:hypothetical protein